jgi:KilA-N domain
MAFKKLIVQGHEISLSFQERGEYICLTDMARGIEGEPGEHIRNWLRNGATIEFLGVWEKVHNPDFNLVEFHQIKSEFTRNTFLMSVAKWLERTGAVGIESRAGRYGGTFAHSDIAIQFATWLSPEFYVYLIKEFQHLKAEQAARLESGWDLRRQLAKINFQIHTEAVREHLVPLIDWNTRREAIFQASEADLLNLALFGMTAREWQAANPDLRGNLRDHASAEQLLVLANLESLNARLLSWNLTRDQRLETLNETAREQMEVLTKNLTKKLQLGLGQKLLPS